MTAHTPWQDAPHDHSTWQAPESGVGYESSYIAQLAQQRLTVDLLREQIPIVRAGEEAQSRLDKTGSRMKDATKGKLRQQVRDGQEAKERLFAAALPLIRTIAGREWRRRRQWGSQVTLDDLTQEAIVGFLKGVSGFNLEAAGRSSTNYLGQWMLVETRRAAETLDHDLQVGHDAGERFRRIRALRVRLREEFDREPTDEEISDASRDLNYVTRPGLVGRAPKSGEARKPGKGVTGDQVAEERRFRNRLGTSDRFGEFETESDSPGNVVDVARVQPVTSMEPETPESTVMEGQRGAAVADLLHAALDCLCLPEMQREIIARRYGLSPHTAETSAREVARILGVQRDRVSRVLAAFHAEMMRPGGALHIQLQKLDPMDVEALEVGWLTEAFNQQPDVEHHDSARNELGDFWDLPTVLTDEIVATQKPDTSGRHTHQVGVKVTFLCDFHDREFSLVVPSRRHAPASRPCPTCQRTSERIRVSDVS